MTARIRLLLLSVGVGVLLVVAIPALAAGVAPARHTALAPAADAQVAVAHLAPFASGSESAVTVTLDSIPLGTNVLYGQSTGYLPVPSGKHVVQVYLGASPTYAISRTIQVTANLHYTAIAVGNNEFNQNLDLKLMEDHNTAPAGSFFKVRIGQLAPFSDTNGTLVDFRLQDGTSITRSVPYSNVARTYTTLPAGFTDFKITAPGGKPTLIDPLGFIVSPGSVFSLFATGDGIHQPLGVFLWPAGQPGFFLPLDRFDFRLPIIKQNSQ